VILAGLCRIATQTRLQLAAHEEHRPGGVAGHEPQEVGAADREGHPGLVVLVALPDVAGALGDHRLVAVVLTVLTPADPPVDHRVGVSCRIGAEVLPHAAEDLAEDLAAHRARHQLGQLLVGRLRHVARKLVRVDLRRIDVRGAVRRRGLRGRALFAHPLLLNPSVELPDVDA
jgi:hypothetical protein